MTNNIIEHCVSEDRVGIQVIHFITQVKYSSPAHFHSTIQAWKMQVKRNVNGTGPQYPLSNGFSNRVLRRGTSLHSFLLLTFLFCTSHGTPCEFQHTWGIKVIYSIIAESLC